MAVFPDVETAQKCLGGMFDMIAADETLGPRFANLGTKVRFEFVKPEFAITVDMTTPDAQGNPITVIKGEGDVEPDAVLKFDSDFAHKFFQGKANVMLGVMKRNIVVVKGNVDEIEKIIPAMKSAFAKYPAMLEQLGCGDLIGK